MLQELYRGTVEGMERSLSSLKRDFSTLRSGRVKVNILDGVVVNYHGVQTRLSSVASVLAKDPTTIVITPWERGLLKDIERALLEANLGANPNSNSDSISLFFPPMTTEQRMVVVKDAKAMSEKAKVSIRSVRHGSLSQVKKLEQDKTITVDESRKAGEAIQRYTDEYVKKVDKELEAKTEEVMRI